MDSRTLATRYDTLFKNEWKQFLDYGPSAQTRYRILIGLANEILGLNKQVAILDSGCGTGQFLAMLSSQGYATLSGCDFSPESIELTRRNLKARSIEAKELFRADLTKRTDFKLARYGLVTCSEVLEHIPEHASAVQTLHSTLVMGGYLIVSVPYRMKYWSEHDNLSLHIRRYEPGEMETLLRDNGFKIIKSIVWGAFFYELYSRILTKVPPQNVMVQGPPSKAKQLTCKALFKLFYLDDLLSFSQKGRRIFIVAQKI